MGLFINTNVASINARRSLIAATENLQSSFRKLSTGLRITIAADDAAGLAISERMRSEISSFTQAQRNANDGISMLQIADGAMSELNSILIRMRELSVQAANGPVQGSDRDSLDEEFQLLIEEIDRIAQSTRFNSTTLLDGSGGSLPFQVGTGTNASLDVIDISLPSVLASDLGIAGLAIDSSTGAGPSNAMDALDTAIDVVTAARGSVGGVQNRLASTIRNIGVQLENLSAAESRIRDVDVALESAELTRNTILQQAALSILAQANVQPQTALTLLGG